MSIFTDLFSTKPAEQAASDKIGYLQQGLGQANSAIDTGLGQANSAVDTGLSSANGYYGQANDLYGKAAVPFTNLIDSTGKGSAAYGDATGANGAEGLARAGALFKSAPGYSGGLTTGIDQAMRTANARGDLGGGNTTADEIKFASDYDANKYGNYVSALSPYLGASQAAASGYAGVLGGNAGLLGSQAGANLAAGNAKAGYDYGAGTAKGGLAYQASSDMGNAQAQADQAKYSASQNFWSALIGGGTAIAKLGAAF